MAVAQRDIWLSYEAAVIQADQMDIEVPASKVKINGNRILTTLDSFTLTLGAFGNTPDPRGATYVGSTLQIQPCDATRPGSIQIGGLQTIPGQKTFPEDVTLSKNLVLPATSGSGVGVLFGGGTPLLHTHPAASGNFFSGGAGNFTCTGTNNVGTGRDALKTLTTGVNNACHGAFAGDNISTGSGNVLHGNNAGGQISSGILNLCLGDNAGFNITTTGNNVCLANAATIGDSNTILVGNNTHTANFTFGALGQIAPAGVPLLIGANHRIGTVPSTITQKENVQNIGTANSARILDIQAKQFTFIGDLNHSPEYGFIAEEMLPIIPESVVFAPVCDSNGNCVTNADGSIQFTNTPAHLRYSMYLPMLQDQLKLQRSRLNNMNQQLVGLVPNYVSV